jgi:hypothetical protein
MNNLLTIAMLGSIYNVSFQHELTKQDLKWVNNRGMRNGDTIKASTRKSKNNTHKYTKAYYNKDMSHFKRYKKSNH